MVIFKEIFFTPKMQIIEDRSGFEPGPNESL